MRRIFTRLGRWSTRPTRAKEHRNGKRPKSFMRSLGWGKMGDATHFHETWPMEYAQDAGKGASKWETAKKLYEKFGCGKDARVRRVAGQVDLENRWTELADCGVGAALLARHKAHLWMDK